MEPTSLTDRIGNVSHLANIASVQYRQRSFVGRHRILMFLVAPVPAAVFCITGIVLLTWAVGSIIPEAWMHRRGGIAAASFALPVLAWTLRLLPFALLTVAFSRTASRTGCGWCWGLTASLLLAIFAAVFAVDYQVPTFVPESGRFSMGLTLPPGPLQAIQFSLTTTMAIVLARRHYRERTMDAGTSGELAC
jgi:hypothetical protein